MVYTQQLPRIIISGTGSAVPPHRLSNPDLEKMVDTSNDWIIERTGISERAISTQYEPLPVLGAVAGHVALKSAGLTAKDIGLIIFANHKSGTFAVPDNATIVQYLLGAECPAHDQNGGCTGGIIAESAGYNALAGKLYAHLMRNPEEEIPHDVLNFKVLVLAGDTLSHVLNYKDRATCILLSDGVGAAVLQFSLDQTVLEKKYGFLGCYLNADGSLGPNLWWKSGVGPQFSSVDGNLTYGGHEAQVKRPDFHMDGQVVFKPAVRMMTEAFEKIVEQEHIDKSSPEYSQMMIDPHQANWRIVDAVRKRTPFAPEQVYAEGIKKYGNNSLGTYMVAQDELHVGGHLYPGRLLAKVAFGAGFIWGADLHRWALNRPKPSQITSDAEKQALVRMYYSKYSEWVSQLCA
ncbi:hypothetical protein C4573_04745 [Candidatus Woesearchaeota archaeon]|nr:MAG: hypothetical protein C4573_04745 [Candidatus Woesearchaeota archaeon]